MQSQEDQTNETWAQYLSASRVILLESSDKEAALRELTQCLCADQPSLSVEDVFSAILEREQTLPTRIAPGIAIPHARINGLQKTVIAVGRSEQGILWDHEAAQPVKLVILIAGKANEHLKILSRLAVRLSNASITEQIMSTLDVAEIHHLLTCPYPSSADEQGDPLADMTFSCFKNALAMARETQATAMVLHADAVGSLAFLDDCNLEGLRVWVVTRDPSRFERCRDDLPLVHVPFGGKDRSGQMNVAFLFLISQGRLARKDRVVSVCGLPESGYLDTVMMTHLLHEHQFFLPEGGADALPEDIEPQVLSRVLQVAVSLASEGREGKPVGTLFVVGDYDRVLPCCRQMVINPFFGYHEEDRNILDLGLEETIKEFSRIDGAFIIRGDGVVESAGTYIRSDEEIENLPSGLGARHAAAAMISQQTSALSVALSESTRKITLYRRGHQVLAL